MVAYLRRSLMLSLRNHHRLATVGAVSPRARAYTQTDRSVLLRGDHFKVMSEKRFCTFRKEESTKAFNKEQSTKQQNVH